MHSSNQQYEAAISKNLAKKAETIESTRKTVDILIGATCHQAEPKKISARKAQKFQLFHPIGTQCVIGVQLVRAKARRKLMHLSLRLAFYIRIELDRSNVDARSLQVHPDKVLCFQGLYGFWRECSSFLNDCKTIENTVQIGFLGISDDSSQIVVTVISLQKQHFRKNIKTRCLQNYKQRIFICRSIIKIVSNHILSLLAAARKYTDKIETTSSDSG